MPNERYTFPITLRQALTYFLDVTSPPSQKLLAYFAASAKDDDDSRKLFELSKVWLKVIYEFAIKSRF